MKQSGVVQGTIIDVNKRLITTAIIYVVPRLQIYILSLKFFSGLRERNTSDPPFFSGLRERNSLD
jgi:hypothetical protein